MEKQYEEVEVKDDPEHVDLPRWLRSIADYDAFDLPDMRKPIRETKKPLAQDVYEDRIEEWKKQQEESRYDPIVGEGLSLMSPEEKQGDWGMAERDTRFEMPSVFKILGLEEEE